MKKFFLDVPVYRLSKDRYYNDMDEYIQKQIYSGHPNHIATMKEFHRKNPDQKLASEQRLRNYYGGAWDFNEIVGYIRLYFFGTQIRGEYWGVNAKRIVKTRKKTFEYKTSKLAPEIDLSWETDSSTIFSRILQYLEDCSKELKGRFIDMGNLQVIGPHVDWKFFYETGKNV